MSRLLIHTYVCIVILQLSETCKELFKSYALFSCVIILPCDLNRYSRLSLSRSRTGPVKHFEISVLRHIRWEELRKIPIEQDEENWEKYQSNNQRGVSIRGYSGPLPNDLIFCRWTALHVYFILVYLCSRTIVVVFELELLKSGWGNSVCWRKAICRLFFVLWCLSKDCNLQ